MPLPRRAEQVLDGVDGNLNMDVSAKITVDKRIKGKEKEKGKGKEQEAIDRDDQVLTKGAERGGRSAGQRTFFLLHLIHTTAHLLVAH